VEKVGRGVSSGDFVGEADRVGKEMEESRLEAEAIVRVGWPSRLNAKRLGSGVAPDNAMITTERAGCLMRTDVWPLPKEREGEGEGE